MLPVGGDRQFKSDMVATSGDQTIFTVVHEKTKKFFLDQEILIFSKNE